MNLGLVTSYIVAGILLLAILMMNINMSTSSTELTMTQISREKVATLTDMISYDIPKIGANRTSTTDSLIVEADSNKISFYSNIDIFTTTDKSVEKITWEFTENPVNSTNNPNDYILERRVEEADGTVQTTQVTLGVTKFLIRYYNEHGAARDQYMTTPVTGSGLEDIKQLDVQITLESPVKVYRNRVSDGIYVKSVWEKRFSPPNLQN